MSEVEIQTESGIAVIENIDNTPPRTSKSALSRLEAIRDRFDELATKRMPSKTFLSLLATRLMEEPKLLQCRFDTLVRAAIQCHAWGLDPTGKNNGAFLIPYKNRKTHALECQLQLGYGAMIDLVTREGKIVDIDAHIVYDQDVFEPELGTNPNIKHLPNIKSSNRGRDMGVAYYAVATFVSGHKKFAVMTRQEIDDIQSKFSRDTPAWRDSYDQMAIKTVIHRLVKTLPVNSMASQALSYNVGMNYELPTPDDTMLSEEQMKRIREAQGLEPFESGADEPEPKGKTDQEKEDEEFDRWLREEAEKEQNGGR